MTVSTFQKMVGTEPFRLIPRCVITQASGKQRVIDDAYVGLQSERSSDANKLVLCSALRPAQHLQYAYAFGPLLNDSMEEWESGGEDWPDAYRFCPMSKEEAMCCVVTFFITNGMSLQSCCIQDSCLGYLWQLHHSIGIVVWWKLWQGDFCFA